MSLVLLVCKSGDRDTHLTGCWVGIIGLEIGILVSSDCTQKYHEWSGFSNENLVSHRSGG